MLRSGAGAGFRGWRVRGLGAGFWTLAGHEDSEVLPGDLRVGGSVLIVTDDPDVQIITVKCEPEHARAHVRDYASITPGRYLDKRHWISLGPGPGITERLVTDTVENSYDLVAERLPRRDRPGAR